MTDQSNGSATGPVKAGQEGIAFLINQASRAFKARLSATISQYGLDTDEYTVLRHLVREIDATPDGLPTSWFAEHLNIPSKTIEQAAEHLERSGWLTTKRDARGMVLFPTRRTLAQSTVLADASLWMLEGALNGFSRDEIDQLTSLLRRVVRNMDAALGEDEGPLVR